MRAVVLAAGRGSRLGAWTRTLPKPLLDLGGVPLIIRLIRTLRGAGLEPVVVTGYRAELVSAAVGRLGCAVVHNPRWQDTGIMASLLAAAQDGALDAGAVVTYSDIVIEARVVDTVLGAPAARVCLPVNTKWLDLWAARMPDPLQDAERLLIGSERRLLDIGGTARDLSEIHAQFMGIVRLSPAGAQDLIGFYRRCVGADAQALGWDTTTMLRAWLRAGAEVTTIGVDGGWLEVDTPADLDLYTRALEQGRLSAWCDLFDPESPAGETTR